MPAPARVEPSRKPNILKQANVVSQIQNVRLVELVEEHEQCAYPPLKAPTGFLTGAAATALASRRRDEDWNVLELRRGAMEGVCRKARIEGASILEAMTDEEV